MGKTKQMGGIKKKRDANFELLRVIAMGMVIALHYLYQSESLIVLKEPLSAVKITGSLLEAFSIVSVNVWVLISGFYLSKSGFRLNRILQLLLEVYFYTLMVSLVMQMVGIYAVKADDSIFRSVQYLFPISSEHYWFATAYMMLYELRNRETDKDPAAGNHLRPASLHLPGQKLRAGQFRDGRQGVWGEVVSYPLSDRGVSAQI